MRLIKAKSEDQVKLEGVDVSFQVVDNGIEAVVITDANGDFIRIAKAETYSSNVSVYLPQPKQEVVHLFVEGKLLDNEISKDFGEDNYTNRQEAEDYIQKLNEQLGFGHGFSVVEKTVLVDPKTI